MADKPPLILVPGLLCDASVWADQAEALSDSRAVTVCDALDFDSLGAMAEFVLDLVPGRFALAGHSMGGRVALEVMRRAPERVERLALMDTGVHPALPHEQAQRQALIDLAEAQGMAALAARWLPPMVAPARLSDPALMQPLVEMVLRASPALFARQQRALLARPDAAPLLAGIGCPVAVIVGREDRWSPPAQHQAIAAAIPGARFTVIEECGHMTTVERPGAVTAALRGWLVGPAAEHRGAVSK